MPARPSSDLRVIPVAFMTFAALGLGSGLLGLAWPSMRAQFGLALDSVNQIYLASTIAGTVVSFLAGRLMSRLGSGMTLLAGAGVLTVSMFGFAAARTWPQVLCLSAASGLGCGLIDAGLNLYVATYHAPRQMNWLHACFGIGSTAGPLVMTGVLGQGLEWQAGYAVAGAVLLVPVAGLAITLGAWRHVGASDSSDRPVERAPFAASFGAPAVWLGIGGFACCVGVEVGAGQWAYTVLVQSRGVRPGVAGLIVSAYWGAFTGGRILFGFLPARVDSTRFVPWLAATMAAAAALFWCKVSLLTGVLGLLLLGVAEAPIFPLLMAGTIRRVGAGHAQNAVAFQMVASGLAAAFIPGAIGTVGEHLGLEAMPLCLVGLSVLAFGFCALSIPAPLPRGMRPARTRLPQQT